MATLAAGDPRAGCAQVRQSLLHAGKRRLVDQGSDQDGIVLEWIADRRCHIDVLQPLEQSGIDLLVYQQSTQGGAALAGSADSNKGNRAQRQLRAFLTAKLIRSARVPAWFIAS
jgi:hypothetical protein